jgi:hypothetical protein
VPGGRRHLRRRGGERHGEANKHDGHGVHHRAARSPASSSSSPGHGGGRPRN